jgi:hypothetical protein
MNREYKCITDIQLRKKSGLVSAGDIVEVMEIIAGNSGTAINSKVEICIIGAKYSFELPIDVFTLGFEPIPFL